MGFIYCIEISTVLGGGQMPLGAITIYTGPVIGTWWDAFVNMMIWDVFCELKILTQRLHIVKDYGDTFWLFFMMALKLAPINLY